MSRLEELINELCPEGVEYKDLCDISRMSAGDRITKAMMSNDLPYPVMGAGVVPTGFYSDWNRKNTVTISRAGVGAGLVGWHPEKFWATDVCFTVEELTESIPIKYLYYAIKSQEKNRENHMYGGSMPKIDKNYLWHMRIPVPPLEVQEKIVKTLDKFTDYVTELQAELQARKQQFEYYRDELLALGDCCQMVPLNEFAEIIRGGNFQKKDFVTTGRPCIHYGQMYTHYGVSAEKTITYVNEDVFNNSKQASCGDIVMAVTSENVDDVCTCTAWLGEENIAVSGHTAIIKHNQNAKYLSYYFRTQHFFKDKKKLAHGTKVIEVTPSKLGNILIPLPSLEEQERLATILDKYDVLCNDLSSGLPAEIEARQKQYEYYRDKLLTFKELPKEA